MNDNLLEQDDYTLLYRGTCTKCRYLSRLAVLMSLNKIRRVPINSDEAGRLYAAYPGTQGQLALFHPGGLVTSWHVVPMGTKLILESWWQWISHKFKLSTAR